MLITNGLNIYPKEVEKALAMHPDIDKVSIAGKPDPVKGEIVHALIVIKPGRTGKEKDIIQFARSYLAPYKVPRKIMFVNRLPEQD
jgi:long-chain acyl-CoA synthetase